MPEESPRSRTLVRQAVRPLSTLRSAGSPTPPTEPRTPRNRALALLALLAAAGLLVYFVGLRGDHSSGDGHAGDRGNALTAPAPEGPERPGDVSGQGRAIHVAAGARPGGDGSAAAPLPTIQAALDVARAGSSPPGTGTATTGSTPRPPTTCRTPAGWWRSCTTGWCWTASTSPAAT